VSVDLYDTLQKLIRHELRGRRFAELGQVQKVYPTDPGNYDADVVLHATDLVLRHVPVLTPRKGFASLPEVGDLVMLQFMGGDVNRPVIVGTLYNGEDRPPENAEGNWVLQLPSGPDDKDSGLRVELRPADPVGFTVALKGDKFELVVQDDDPVARLTIAGTVLTIDANGGVKLDGAGDVEIQAAGKLKLGAGQGLDIQAGSTLALKASKIDLN
jgi:phage baseplate assembly protein gpV